MRCWYCKKGKLKLVEGIYPKTLKCPECGATYIEPQETGTPPLQPHSYRYYWGKEDDRGG